MPGIGFRTFAVFIAVAALAQQSQQPSPSPSPSPSPGSIPTPSPGSPGRQPSPGDRPTSPAERTPFPSETARPIFLSGKVMMDDGTPPPEPIVIERICNGNPRPEAYTDSKGHFSFQLGQQMGMMPDASVSSAADSTFGGMPGMMGSQGRTTGGFGDPRGGVTEQQLMGCELRAALPGYRSDVVNLAGRRVFDNPDVGVIVLHRLGNVEGTTISATSLNAPKDARKAFEKGREALRKKKVADARKELEKAVGIYPKYASAWFELGLAQEAQNQTGEARNSYAKALEADAKFISPYLAMALISAKEKKWQDVVDTTGRAIKLNPFDFPQAYFYNSVANYNLGNAEAAEKSAREAQKLDTAHRYPKVEHLLGIILADRREYGAAAEQMRNYLKFAPGAQDAATVRTQLSEIEKLAGQKP